jgi:hypothetical protein
MKFKLLDMKDYDRLIKHRVSAYKSSEINYLTELSPNLNLEKKLDECSKIFCHSHAGEIVVSCRITDLKYADPNLIDKINQLAPELDILLTFLISRLCVNKTHQGHHVYQHILKCAYEWAFQNTSHQNFIAICRIRHLVLYKRLGCKEIKNSRYYDDTADAEYALVKGNIHQSADMLS